MFVSLWHVPIPVGSPVEVKHRHTPKGSMYDADCRRPDCDAAPTNQVNGVEPLSARVMLLAGVHWRTRKFVDDHRVRGRCTHVIQPCD